MLKYVAVFSFEVGGGHAHAPPSLSCYSTLLAELETSYSSCSYRKRRKNSATCSTHESGSGI